MILERRLELILMKGGRMMSRKARSIRATGSIRLTPGDDLNGHQAPAATYAPTVATPISVRKPSIRLLRCRVSWRVTEKRPAAALIRVDMDVKDLLVLVRQTH